MSTLVGHVDTPACEGRSIAIAAGGSCASWRWMDPRRPTWLPGTRTTSASASVLEYRRLLRRLGVTWVA
jgi:hypothetical protein